MEPVKSNSKTKFIVIGGIAVTVAIILVGAVYAFVQVGSSTDQKQTNEDTTQSSAKAEEGKVITQQTLNQGMSELDENMKQSKEAHAEASAAVNDASKRVKVSE